jgi:predicted metal-dependent hydrolase
MRRVLNAVAGLLVVAAGIGLALKWHQRDVMLARGITEIRWTFDPPGEERAWLNLTRPRRGRAHVRTRQLRVRADRFAAARGGHGPAHRDVGHRE